MSEFKNWAGYKEALLEGLNDKQAAILGGLMENAHKENLEVKDAHNTILVQESTSTGSTTTGNISRFDMMFMPLVRRVVPSLLAMDLVGVQPLQASRGIVRTIRHRYSETTNDTAGAGGVPVVTADDEASGMNVYEKYSKLAIGGNYDEVDTLDPFAQTAYLEGNRGKSMDLEVVTDSVETMSRKLSAAYSLESADDLMAYDGLDIEAELAQSLGDEILREMDRELVTELTALAGIVESFDFAAVDGRYAGEKLAALTIALDNLSGRIAIATKKAGANWMVVSQKIYTGLKNASNSTFVPAQNGQFDITSSLFVGTLGGSVKVYVDPYLTTDTVLMGYKGSEIDAGLIYCPYIPLSSSGVVRNPETGDFRVMMRSRYGLYKSVDTAKSLGTAPDYYATSTIANINLGFSN